jgi:hypothetical protein
MHTLAIILSLALSIAPTAVPTPPSASSDWFLYAYVDNSAPIIATSGYTAMLRFTYGGVVAARHDEIPSFFPATYAGGAPAEWGVRSVDGLHVTLGSPHTFDAADLYPGPELIEPASVVDLASGGVPVSLSELRYREDDAQHYGIDQGCSPGNGPCTWYDHGLIALYDFDYVPTPLQWTATVTVELYCVYKDGSGSVTGVLTSADVGLPTATDTVTQEYLPVPAPARSWGTLKSFFPAND